MKYFIFFCPSTAVARVICVALARIASAVWVITLSVIVFHWDSVAHVLIKKLIGCRLIVVDSVPIALV